MTIPSYRLVMDSNQLSPFLARASQLRSHPQVTLALYVLTEILLRPRVIVEEVLQKLSHFNVLIGLEPRHVMQQVATLSEKEIISFVPFRHALRLPLNPSAANISQAREIKDRHRAFGGIMSTRAKEARRQFRDRAIKPELSTLSDALEIPFLKSLAFGAVSSHGTPTLTEDVLYNSVMRNQYLSKFFKTILFYMISYTRGWENEDHNFDPSYHDDWTDITLPLYAGDEDIVLTADTKLRNAIEQLGRVRTGVADDLK